MFTGSKLCSVLTDPVALSWIRAVIINEWLITCHAHSCQWSITAGEQNDGGLYKGVYLAKAVLVIAARRV